MVFMAILTVTLVVAFFMCISAYGLGVKHGLQFKDGRVPKVNLNPVRAITQVVERHEQKQEEKKAEEELSDIMSCTAESMLKAIKKDSSR